MAKFFGYQFANDRNDELMLNDMFDSLPVKLPFATAKMWNRMSNLQLNDLESWYAKVD